jgi:Flp pilus assembly pilin Flp
MLVKIRTKITKAQASLEYAALIGVVIGAIVIMSTYLKRSVEGKLRSNADDIGDQYDISSGTYDYSENLQGSESTYSAVGIDTQSSGTLQTLGAGWVQSENIGQGTKMQWTQNTAARVSNETIDTGN